MRNVTILGSTGQIGRKALEVVKHLKGFNVYALAANKNWQLMHEQILSFKPKVAVMLNESGYKKLKDSLPAKGTKILYGEQALEEAIKAKEVDTVLCAIAGSNGLQASFAAVNGSKTLALANKESVVMAGELLLKASNKKKATIIPVDSEHSAIFQALHVGNLCELARIILTASGGPFRIHKKSKLDKVTPRQALNHPVWKMGKKITIDSATLMNKALEIIEARWLFDCTADKIDVIIHPESIVHSIVEFCDGSCIAQLSIPDMKIPIRYALTYPQRVADSVVQRLDLTKIGKLTFERPDHDKFPSLKLGYYCAKMGGTSGACLNAADEVAIEYFLGSKINLRTIYATIDHVLSRHKLINNPSLEDILDADSWARQEAKSFLNSHLR